MSIQRLAESAGGSLQPGQIAQGPLARVLTPQQIAAVEACFSAIARPSGPPPGAPTTPTLRQLSAQEKDALRVTADRVRSTVVVVGEIDRGTFLAGGSGFVYSADGLVMTNAHVLAGLKASPAVMLYDGRALPAEVIGKVTSEQPDVGVLRVRATGLSVAEIGDSNSVRPGDALLHIAHPRGYGYWLATAGQAYGQSDMSTAGGRGYVGVLFSNVPSAPGASGGPMFDARGKVVGLVYSGSVEDTGERIEPSPLAVIRDPPQWSSIARRPRTSAVPINEAMRAARDLVAAGRDVEGAWRPITFPDHRLQGTALQIVSSGEVEGLPGDLKGDFDRVVSTSFQGLRVVDARRNAEGYLVTFSAAPPQAAVDLVLGPFGTYSRLPPEVAGSVPEHVVEALPTPAPGPDDARVLAAFAPLLAAIVHIETRSGAGGSQGTGSIISADGHVLTNAHVVKEDDATFTVTLRDGRQFPARRVGFVSSQSPDVGVLKIEATGLPTVVVGAPAGLQRGTPVFLIGHPALRGYWRVSAGAFLQTDRSFGHAELWATGMSFTGGNSGGPLVNERGAVLGVFHGSPPLDVGPIRPSPPELVWGWHAFDQLLGHDDERLRVAASVEIDAAMAIAQRIIQRQGNIP